MAKSQLDFQTANAYLDTFTSGNNGNGSNVGIKSKRGIIGSSNNVSTNGGAACPSGNYSNAVSGSGSGGNSEHESETTRTLDVVDQLHDLFRNMSIFDETPESTREPIPPNNFLQAVGKLNPMFEGMPRYRYVTEYFSLLIFLIKIQHYARKNVFLLNILGNQQQDAHELLVTVLNTLQDIKIPVPVQNNTATDVIDHAISGRSQGEIESHNGGVKKGKQKKTGKSIFYPGVVSIAHSNTTTTSSSSTTTVSNGVRSSSSDPIDSSSQCTNVASANGLTNITTGK